MKKLIGIFIVMLLITIACAPLLMDSGKADWDLDEGWKMHYPQTPDEDSNYDIYATMNADTDLVGWVADDWTCSETGYVSDIHFWGVWKGDQIGVIQKINISIRQLNWGGDPIGSILWARDFYPADIQETTALCDTLWADPFTDEWGLGVKQYNYYGYNIEDIQDPFIQEEGYIYWLCIGAYVEDPTTYWGWKCTDAAHHLFYARCRATTWGSSDILNDNSYYYKDMAFVINGEPIEPPNVNIDVDKYVPTVENEPLTVEVGDEIEFKIDVTNNGDMWDSLSIRDNIPNCLQYIQNSAQPDDSDPGVDFLYGTNPGDDVGWYIADFPNVQIYSFTYKCKVVCHPINHQIENFVEVTAKIDDTEATDNDKVKMILLVIESDLDADGELNWMDISPGGEVNGTIQISNIGDKDSELKWEIDSHPTWGTWTFTPADGANLKPEDGPVQVEVEVEAPDEKEKLWNGAIKIVNIDNPDDYEIISVSLSTPKNKLLNEFYPWIFRFIQGFHFLRFILIF